MKFHVFCLAAYLMTAASLRSAPGGLDSTFTNWANSTVRCLALQSDRRILVGGDFNHLGSASHLRLGRLNEDGTLDPNFNPSTDGPVYSIAQQSDGRIIISGDFTTANGATRSRVARLNASGTLDTTFNPGQGPNSTVLALAVQPDGKVIIAGYFTSVAGVSRNNFARLNANGTLDTSFNIGSGPDGTVFATGVQADQKILLAGSFGSINGTTSHYIARLNTDGSLDTSFNTAIGPNGLVNCLLVLANGQILIGGSFTAFNGSAAYQQIARLNTDASPDNTFHSPSFLITAANALGVQGDGKVLFAADGPVGPRIGRLNPDGSQDPTFNPFTPPSGSAYAVAMQSDTKWLVGGSFSPGLNRLRGDAPFIDNQPADRTAAPGDTIEFGVNASGLQPLYYQWLKDGTNIVGATDSVLTLTNVQPNQTGYYSATVTNNSGSVTSASAALTIYGAPLVLADGQVVAGTATRNFSSMITLQTAFPGGYIFYTLDGTAPTFSSAIYAGPFRLTNSTTIRALSLSLDFTQSYPSPAAHIQILQRSVILTGGGGYVAADPSQALYEDGAMVTLYPVPDYGWSFDHWQGDASGTNSPLVITINTSKTIQAIFITSGSSNIVGIGHITLTPPGPFPFGTNIQIRAIPDPGNKFVVWGDSIAGTNNPLSFAVVNPAPIFGALFSAAPPGVPTIVTQPTSQSTTLFSRATFTVTASGATAYQWRLNGNPIAGATTSSLTLTNVSPTQAGEYDVVVTGPGGSILSGGAQLALMDFNMRPVISVFANPGTAFQVQYSDSLSNGTWFVLTNAVLFSFRQDVIDFSNTNTQRRFYRVVLPGP